MPSRGSSALAPWCRFDPMTTTTTVLVIAGSVLALLVLALVLAGAAKLGDEMLEDWLHPTQPTLPPLEEAPDVVDFSDDGSTWVETHYSKGR